MDNAKKLKLLEDLFNIDEDTLTMETVLENIEEYDSMAKLSLIVMLDEECNKVLTGDDIKAFKTVADIANFMG